MGIEVTLALFSKKGLQLVFEKIDTLHTDFDANIKRIISLKETYIHTIDAVIVFLQGGNPMLAHSICKRDLLPEAARYLHANDMEKVFGNMGIQDKAKYIATMYLEDLSDLIKSTVDEHFGFSRYAERLGRSANSFDELYEELKKTQSIIDEFMVQILEDHIRNTNPKIVALSVPFPGNLFSSLRCGQWLKANYPNIKIIMGGGFANTELRSLSDKRVFEFYDYISLDDGEAPLENLIGYIEGSKTEADLKRTFLLQNTVVTYANNTKVKDYKQGEVGTPDYSNLKLNKYISALEIANPMHRLWSDGRWNKLTMAHGCYWGKCTFCDVSLDYIKLYEPVAAGIICDRMQELMLQTEQTGFHFVDEAAPPALMRAIALEIIKRNMVVTWWTNVRFEKSFTKDLCLLLSQSGCIAVSGGLEVASDRLLQLIEKGITVAQVATVNKNFTEAGILVHAYLMYGYPTQTDQETVDSLEMVRQLFANNVLQSAFWHRFALTVHSPVGLNPEKYNIKITTTSIGTFANNDAEYEDLTGGDHESFGYGLKKSLFNYMHGIGLDDGLQKWFDHKIPKTKIDPNYIEQILVNEDAQIFKANAKIIFNGNKPSVTYTTQSKKGYSRELATLIFETQKSSIEIQLLKPQADWLIEKLTSLHISNEFQQTLQQLKDDYEAQGLEDFELFWFNKPMNTKYRFGLLVL